MKRNTPLPKRAMMNNPLVIDRHSFVELAPVSYTHLLGLNDDNIPTPGQYFKGKNPDKKKYSRMSEKISWTASMVYKILTSCLLYTSHLPAQRPATAQWKAAHPCCLHCQMLPRHRRSAGASFPHCLSLIHILSGRFAAVLLRKPALRLRFFCFFVPLQDKGGKLGSAHV